MSKVPIVFFIVSIVIVFVVLINIFPEKIGKFFNLPDFNFNKQEIISSPPLDTNTPTPSATPYTGARPDTAIVSGPAEGEFVKDSAVVIFHYVAIWGGEMNGMTFETKLSGVDNDWQATSMNARSIILPAGDRNYTFQVRAKTKDGILDATPVERNFRAIVSENIGKVKIISATPGRYPNQAMKITLRNDGPAINISGWTLTAGAGKFVVPTGKEVYNPTSNDEARNIVLNSGDYLFVYGQNSPMDMNFKINKCFGYLNTIYNFEPDLYNNCPRPEKSEMTGVSIACQNYLIGLSACQIPNSDELNKYAEDSACRSFATSRLNYTGCFNRYRYDTDFLGREWYTYSGVNIMKEKDDVLTLRDASGLYIDEYTY